MGDDLTVRFTARRLQRVRLRQGLIVLATACVRERGKFGEIEQGRGASFRRTAVEHTVVVVDAIPTLRSVSSRLHERNHVGLQRESEREENVQSVWVK